MNARAFLFAGLVQLLVPIDARAEPLPVGDQAIAKGDEGMTAYDRGDWAVALAAFEQAEHLFHSPVFLLYQARSLRNLGRLREARRRFEQVVGEALPDGAPPTWIQAKSDAQNELAALVEELPQISVLVRGAGSAARVTIDREPAAIGTPFDADPGEHRVTLVDGARVLEKTVTVRRGLGIHRVEFDITPRTISVGGASPPPPSHSWLIAGITLGGVGVALVGAGGVLGGVALSRAKDADAARPLTCTADGLCLEEDRATIDAAYQGAYDFANAADALFIAGGTLIMTGLVFVIVDRVTGKSAARPRVTAHGVGFSF